jgi:hypothetical protein
MPEAQLGGRMQMERSAQGPRFDEQAAFPEGLPDIRLADPVEPRGELELCGSLNLRVNAADVADDVDESIGGRSLSQG